MPNKAKKKVDKRIEWELILQWKPDSRQPFIWQKLGFKAGPLFKDAYADAVKIRQLLRRAGNYEPGDVKLVAVGRVGVLREHDKEKGIQARAVQQDMLRLVKEGKEIGKKKPMDKKLMRTRG